MIIVPESRDQSAALEEMEDSFQRDLVTDKHHLVSVSFFLSRGALSENLDRKTSELFEEIGVDINEEDGETFEDLNRLTGSKRRRFK